MARARSVVVVAAGGGKRALAGLVPVVMSTHSRAVRVCAAVVLDHVASEGVTAGRGVAASDAWDDVAMVGVGRVGLGGVTVGRLTVGGVAGGLLLLPTGGVVRDGAVDGILGEDVGDAFIVLLVTTAASAVERLAYVLCIQMASQSSRKGIDIGEHTSQT